MNTLLDNLFARRPKIHYVCPPLCGCPEPVISSSGSSAVSFDAVSPLECVKYRFENGNLVWDDYPGAVCYNVYQAPAPPAPAPVGLPCVTYYLTDNTSLSSNFTWNPYPDATSYNIYRTLPANPDRFVKTQSNIPLMVLPINCESIVVTANTPIGETLACEPITYCSVCHAEIDNWLSRVISAGGSMPPDNEFIALCDFITSMKSAGLWDRMYSVNHFSPSSIVGALTWLKSGLLPDVYTWNPGTYPASCIAGVNGFDPNGGEADTGVKVSDIFTDETNCGVTAYASQALPLNTINGSVCGSTVIGPPGLRSAFALFPYTRFDADPAFGYSQGSCWDFDHEIKSTTPTPGQVANKGCGYVSMNRTNINEVAIYYEAFNSPHSRVAYTNVSHQVPVPTTNLKLFTSFDSSVNYEGTVGFLALHQALTKDESKAFSAILQTLRVGLGGGFA